MNQIIYLNNILHFSFRDNRDFLIESQKLDGSDRKFVVLISDQVDRIAYDWIGHNMFYSAINHIGVISLTNSTMVKQLVADTYATSLVLDPKGGRMFWSTWSLNDTVDAGLIEHAWMDGTHRGILANSSRDIPMHSPFSLSIDYMERMLYWCDPRLSLIARIGLDGSNHQLVIKNSEWYPYSLAYHHQYLFWSDDESTIRRLHMNTDNPNKSYKFKE